MKARRKVFAARSVVVRRLAELVQNWLTVIVRYVAARFGVASGMTMTVRLRDGLDYGGAGGALVIVADVGSLGS